MANAVIPEQRALSAGSFERVNGWPRSMLRRPAPCHLASIAISAAQPPQRDVIRDGSAGDAGSSHRAVAESWFQSLLFASSYCSARRWHPAVSVRRALAELADHMLRESSRCRGSGRRRGSRQGGIPCRGRSGRSIGSAGGAHRTASSREARASQACRCALDAADEVADVVILVAVRHSICTLVSMTITSTNQGSQPPSWRAP